MEGAFCVLISFIIGLRIGDTNITHPGLSVLFP